MGEWGALGGWCHCGPFSNAVIFGTDSYISPGQNKQAILRFSPFLALGGVTISRRSAAGSCADAQGPLTRTRGRVRSVQSTSPSASIWWVTGDYGADKGLQILIFHLVLSHFTPVNNPVKVG